MPKLPQLISALRSSQALRPSESESPSTLTLRFRSWNEAELHRTRERLAERGYMVGPVTRAAPNPPHRDTGRLPLHHFTATPQSLDLSEQGAASLSNDVERAVKNDVTWEPIVALGVREGGPAPH